MTRIKKKRTEKSIGAAKKPLLKQSEKAKLATKRKGKGKGRPAGAKANIDGASTKKSRSGSSSNNSPIDAKVGSKKPIELIPQAAPKTLEPRVKLKKAKPQVELSLEQQLAQVENDERLNTLLDSIDAGDKISDKDQAYIEHQTASHQKLIEALGLDVDEDDEEEEEIQEEWEQIDSSEFDEFKD